MKKILLFGVMILLVLSNLNSQEINIIQPSPELMPAWDIQVICTAPVGCTPPYKVTAFTDGSNSKFWVTNDLGYVVANMAGMPAYDSKGNLLRYYITANPINSDIPCGMTEAFYPTGSVYVEIIVRQGPCNMY